MMSKPLPTLARHANLPIRQRQPIGQRYFEPADILDAGIMLAVENLREKCGLDAPVRDYVFDSDVSREFMERLTQKTAYQLTGKQLYFYGICPSCQKKRKGVH